MRPRTAISTRRPSPVRGREITSRYGAARNQASPGTFHSRKRRVHCSQQTMASEPAASATMARPSGTSPRPGTMTAPIPASVTATFDPVTM